MAQIARTPQRPVRARNMIDLVTNSVPRLLRGLGPLLPLMLPLPRRRLVQRPVRRLRAPCLAVDRLLLRVAVVRRAGELVQQPHLKTPAGKVLMSPLAATRVTTRTATVIVVSVNLLPVTLPMAVGAAEAQAVSAVALGALAVQVVLGAPAAEVAICPGIKFGRC